MSRLRWAAAVLAGGLGLIGGCATCRDHPWFGRGRAAPAPNCCDSPTVPIAEGPVLEGGPPAVPPPGVEIQQPAVNGNLRPIPRPDAQPVPAPPTSRRVPGLISDRWKD